MMYEWWGFGPPVMLLFWAFVIAGIVWLALTISRGESHRSQARQILGERLARGEIDAEEYRARLRALQE